MKGPMLHFFDDNPKGSTAIAWAKLADEREGHISKRIDDENVDQWVTETIASGPEWGMIGEIAEGKIPLSVFDGYQILGVQGWYYSYDINPCDEFHRRFDINPASKASFDWFGINHSIYEDGRDTFRIAFKFRDANDEIIYEDVLTNLEMTYDPFNLAVDYPTDMVKYYSYPVNRVRYDINSDTYRMWLENYVEYYGPVEGNLPSGLYELRATVATPLSGEHDIEITRHFDHYPVSLPMVSSNSFRTYNDVSDNFSFEWDAPQGIDDC